MRCFPRALGAVVATACACVALPAVSSASSTARAAISTGGSPAAVAAPQPSAQKAGGSEYRAVSSAGAPPVVSVLEVPRTVVSGKPPTVRLRIASASARTVHAKVILYTTSAREPLIAINMGWVHPGRLLTARWPRGTRLQAGSYYLAVGVHGHRTGPARVFAHASRTTQLTVTAAPTAPTPVTPMPPGVPTPAQTAAMGAVFPVAGAHNFGNAENRFGAPRSGHVHEGQDVLTAEGVPVVAPLAGTIITTGYQPSAAGYYAAEHTAVGLDFFFAHCEAQSLLVKAEQIVAAGQQLCSAGQTGDASAPHLHFEIWVGGWRAAGGYAIDPLPYLEAWERAGA